MLTAVTLQGSYTRDDPGRVGDMGPIMLGSVRALRDGLAWLSVTPVNAHAALSTAPT